MGKENRTFSSLLRASLRSIELEEDDVAILHIICSALLVLLALVAALGFALEGVEVGPVDHLGANEALLHVRVNPPSCLRSLRSSLNCPALDLIAAGAMVFALTLLLTNRPYWQYASLLTLSIVILEGGENIIATDEARLWATIIGAAAVLIVTAIAEPFSKKYAIKQGVTQY